MKKKLSIHDIARQLNISAATVSFVLNGKGIENRISRDMEQKILKHVKEVGYQPNMIAKSLRTGKSHIIGMLIEDISDPFFSKVSRIVEMKAYKLGYKIFYASTENDDNKTKELIRVFRERQVDGYIIAPPPGIEDDIRSLLNDNCPVILFDRFLAGVETTNIIVNNQEGAYIATTHLIENNYSQVAFVTLDSEQSQMTERMAGYLDGIKDSQKKSYIHKIPYNQTHEQIVAEVDGFLEKNQKIDAILFATNYLAIGGLEAIKARNFNIPEDIGVVGFDDNTHFALFSPSITAVAQPVQELSEEVIKQLLRCLENVEQNFKKETIVLSTSLVIRNSSVPARFKKPEQVTQTPMFKEGERITI